MNELERVDFAHQWYAIRWKRLRQLIHEEAPEIEAKMCSIIANGTTSAATGGYEPPTYAQLLNQAKHRAEKAEAEIRRLTTPEGGDNHGIR